MKILTLEQAAEYLQLSPMELEIELKQKRIHGVQVATQWRITQESLDKLFEIENELPQSQKSESQNLSQVNGDHEQVAIVNVIEPYPESITSQPQISESQNVFQLNGDSQPIVTSSPSPLSSNRFLGEVFAYNTKQRFGYARLADGRVIWIDESDFIGRNYTPKVGDKITFEVEKTRNGPRGRQIQSIGNEIFKKDKVATETSKSISVPQERPSHTFTQIDVKLPSLSIPKTVSNVIGKKIEPLSQPRPRPSYAGTFEAQSLYEKAAVARNEGKFNIARRLFRQALEAGGGFHMYEPFAKMLLEQGFKEEAQQVLLQAIEQFPDKANLYIMYGQMERRGKSYQKAEEIFRLGLKRISYDRGLKMGLAQVLVQKGTESSLKEAGIIFEDLKKYGQLNTDDRFYHRYLAFQRAPRANKAFEFFQECLMKPGITGSGNLPKGVTDLVVDFQQVPEFRESFGLTDATLVRCFNHMPRQADLVELQRYLQSFGSQDILGLQDGRRYIISKSIAFIVVNKNDSVRDLVMNTLSENKEALIPLDDNQLESPTTLQTLRDVLGQYLGHRDLYNSTLPVSKRRFFGREKLLRHLVDQIQIGQFLGIYGLRKMGKTSLLYKLRDENLPEEAVAYVDLQSSATQSVKNCNPLYWEIERDLYKRLAEPYPKIAETLRLGKIARFSELPNDGQKAGLIFSEDLQSLLEAMLENQLLPIKRLVIVLDELERILPIGHSGVEGYLEFFSFLRGLAQTERYRGVLSSIVVAANAAISERGYWQDRENPVFALYKPIFLTPFSLEECNEMVITLGKGMSVYWTEEALQAIYAETGGHPFLTRLFCSRIIKQYSKRPLHVNIDLVQAELSSFIREEGNKFEQITELLKNHFPNEEILLEQIALDEAPPEIPDKDLTHLLGYHLIRPNGQGYQITINLLHRWLRRRAGVRE